MKLRIRGNSIRLRLTQSEISMLEKEGEVTEKIQFGISANQVLSYKLLISHSTDKIQAQYDSQQIIIQLPPPIANDWIHTNQTGIEAQQALEYPNSLHILLEKDFKCLADRVGEDESDAFPNPLQDQANC